MTVKTRDDFEAEDTEIEQGIDNIFRASVYGWQTMQRIAEAQLAANATRLGVTA